MRISVAMVFWLVIGWVMFALLAIGIVAMLSVPSYAKPQPTTEPTNKVWSCGYPYPQGLCMADRKKVKHK